MLWLRPDEARVEEVISLIWCVRVGIGRGEVGGFEDVGDEMVVGSVGEVADVMVGETSAVVLSVFGERERDRPRSGSVIAARKLRWVGVVGVVGGEFEIGGDDDMVGESWLFAACEVDVREEAEDGLVVVVRAVLVLLERGIVADGRGIERFFESTAQGQFLEGRKYGMPAWLKYAAWKP